jgi:hypothetical protein
MGRTVFERNNLRYYRRKGSLRKSRQRRNIAPILVSAREEKQEILNRSYPQPQKSTFANLANALDEPDR